MALSAKEWVNFFKKAGIPAEESASYALIFNKNRIQRNMLPDLNKEYLKDMGITLLGDIIAILKHAQVVHESHSRASVLTSATAEEIDLTKKKSTIPKAGSTVKRLLDHYTRKYEEAEGSLAALPSPGPEETSNADMAPNSSKTKLSKNLSHVLPVAKIEKKRTFDERNSAAVAEDKGLDAVSMIRPTLALTKAKKRPNDVRNTVRPPAELEAPPRAHGCSIFDSLKTPAGKPSKKKTIFSRLGDGTVSSTTPESLPSKTVQSHSKSQSVFARLGEVSSTSSEEGISMKKDVLPYAGVFKSLGASAGTGSSMRADQEDELSSSASSSGVLVKARLSLNKHGLSLPKSKQQSSEVRRDFLKARELKMLKITTEFVEEEEVAEIEVNPSGRFRPMSSATKLGNAGRKRKAGESDLSEISLSKPKAKKVRFGGATHAIIPSATSHMRQKPSKLLQNFTNLKIIAGDKESSKEGIKARIGGKQPSVLAHSKMVSDTMVVQKQKTVKPPVKARIALNAKKSVHDRLG